MRSTRNLNSRQAALALVVLVLLSVAMLSTTAHAAAPSAWPDGWSREQSVIEARPHYGHLSAPAGFDSLWLASVGYQGPATVLQVTLFSLERNAAVTNITLPVTHLLRGFTLLESDAGLSVFWIERQEGIESTLHRAKLDTNGQLLRQDILWRTPALADSPAVAAADDDTFYIALSAAIDGHHAIHLLSFTSGSETPLVTRLTTPDELATVPTIALAGDRLHLVFHRHRQHLSWARYHLYELPMLTRLATTELGAIPQDYEHAPTLLANPDGSVSVIWQRMHVTPARVIPMEPVQGRLLNGEWVEPLSSLIHLRGRILSARGARSDDGRTLVAAMVEVGRAWQVKSILRDGAGNTVRAGYATITRGHALGARPLLVGNVGVISFFSHDNAGRSQLYVVQTATPAQRTLAFRVGLNPHSPWADALYKYMSLLTGAVFVAFGATGAMAISLVAIWLMSHFGLFSSSRLGSYLRLALQFAIIVALKEPGSLLYFGAVMLPGWTAVVSWLAAASLTVAVIHLADMPADDFLTLSFAGLLFVIGDSFTSLFMAGVGRW
ncbi:MAG: hypothetical protein KGZ66_06845 [Selenomonadales bacterium]|nr:hypothetical protein [Selenomonadales bacterium]